MPRLVLALALAPLLVLAACPGEPPGDDAGPPPPDAGDLVDALSDFLIRCSDWAPGTFAAEVEPTVSADVRARLETQIKSAYGDALDNPNLDVDEALIPACIAWLEGATCGEEPGDGECDGVVTGTIADDGPCLDDGECVSDYCLRPDPAACGTCASIRQGGESCRRVDDATGDVISLRCADAFYCGPISGECEDKLGQGALCTNDAQCQDDHLCIGLPSTCQRVTRGEAAGDACTVLANTPTCGTVLRTGLRCTGTQGQQGLCVALEVVELNGTCDTRADPSSGTRWCAEGLTTNWCNIPQGADVGVCAVRPIAGEDCIASQGRCRNDSLCVVTDNNPLDPAAACQAVPEVGEPCLADAIGSDGCATVGNFHECDDDPDAPVCVETGFGADEEAPPACTETPASDAGP